jgi:RNA polymerase subunit RPABC4/transcription elongation factor Spt4
MKNCYSCQKEVDEDFKFCPYCGVKLTEMECPKCGYVNEPNSKFCQECGAKLENGQPVAQKQKVKTESATVTEIIEPLPINRTSCGMQCQAGSPG